MATAAQLLEEARALLEAAAEAARAAGDDEALEAAKRLLRSEEEDTKRSLQSFKSLTEIIKHGASTMHLGRIVGPSYRPSTEDENHADTTHAILDTSDVHRATETAALHASTLLGHLYASTTLAIYGNATPLIPKPKEEKATFYRDAPYSFSSSSSYFSSSSSSSSSTPSAPSAPPCGEAWTRWIDDMRAAGAFRVAAHGDLRTQTTVVDRSVRDALEMDVDDDMLARMPPIADNGATLRTLADAVTEELGARIGVYMEDVKYHAMRVKAVPYRVNLYEVGGHFDEHVDSPSKGPGTVGTLVVALPVAGGFKGGSLVIRDPIRRSLVVDVPMAPTAKKPIKFCAVLGDCPHRVEEVRSGVRVTLTFTLHLEAGDTRDRGYSWTSRPKPTQGPAVRCSFSIFPPKTFLDGTNEAVTWYERDVRDLDPAVRRRLDKREMKRDASAAASAAAAAPGDEMTKEGKGTAESAAPATASGRKTEGTPATRVKVAGPPASAVDLAPLRAAIVDLMQRAGRVGVILSHKYPLGTKPQHLVGMDRALWRLFASEETATHSAMLTPVILRLEREYSYNHDYVENIFTRNVYSFTKRDVARIRKQLALLDAAASSTAPAASSSGASSSTSSAAAEDPAPRADAKTDSEEAKKKKKKKSEGIAFIVVPDPRVMAAASDDCFVTKLGEEHTKWAERTGNESQPGNDCSVYLAHAIVYPRAAAAGGPMLDEEDGTAEDDEEDDDGVEGGEPGDDEEDDDEEDDDEEDDDEEDDDEEDDDEEYDDEEDDDEDDGEDEEGEEDDGEEGESGRQ